MKKVLLALTGIIAIVTIAILLIVCVKDDDNGSSSNLNNVTIENNTDFTSEWAAKVAVEGDYETETTFEISDDVQVSGQEASRQELVVNSGVTLRITNKEIPVKIGSSDDILGNQLILKNTTIKLMEQAKLILDVNVILDDSSIISGATEGDAYFYPNLEINDSVLLMNTSKIDSTNFNSTKGVVVNGTLNLDGSNANLTSDSNLTGDATSPSDATSPITLTEKAMVIAINGATISGKIEGNGGFVTDGTIETSKLANEIGKLENMTVVDDLDSIDASGNYIVYKALDDYNRISVEFGFNNENVYNSGQTTRIIPFYDYLANGNQKAQFNVNEGSTLELGGFTKDGKTYQANTNKFIIDGGANWVKGSNVYFVTGDYDPYNEEGTNPETDNRSAYNNNGTTKTWPILYVRKNSTANLFGGVVIQNVDNTNDSPKDGTFSHDYGTINVDGVETKTNVWGQTIYEYYRPKLNVYGATIRFNHANGKTNSIGGAAISANYGESYDEDEADIYIADCDISYNSVWNNTENTSPDGAAIGLFQNVNLVMNDGVISHNHGGNAQDSDGGAIMVRMNSNLTMNGGTLSYNFVYGYGGAICIYSSSVTINSGNLIYNRATFGGGIASSGAPVEINLGSSDSSDLYVAYNEAYKNTTIDEDTGYGGGVALGNSGAGESYRQNEEIYIYGGLFEYNKALYGGGIASYTVNRGTGNKLTLEGGEIRNNNATNGAGLYIESNGENNNVPLLYLSGSAKVDTSNNIQIKGNVSGQVPIEVTDTLTASGIIGLISYVDTNLYQGNPNAVYFNGTTRQADKFLLDSATYCFVMSSDPNYIEIDDSNTYTNQPYSIEDNDNIEGNEKKYSNLKAAVDAISDNATATILVHRNVSLTEDDLVTINNNKHITIKSDGDKPFTLAISKDFDFSSQDTSNPGILRINPGCELTLENINLDGNSSVSDGFAFVYNTGTFTLGETASLNNNISNLNGGAINIQQAGSITNIYGSIIGNKGPNGAIYATGENITINIFKTAVIQNNTALSVNPTLGKTGSSITVENVGLYLGAGVTCNFHGFSGLQDAIFYAGATLNIVAGAVKPSNNVNVYVSNQFYKTSQIIFNVDSSLSIDNFVNKFTFANGLENDSFTNGSNNTIIINKVVKAIFNFSSDEGDVEYSFLTREQLNELAKALRIDSSLVTRQGHKLVIYMDVNSQLSLNTIASSANMAGYKITGFKFNESTHSLTENVPFYEVSGVFTAIWEENTYKFTFSHEDFNDVNGEMTSVTYRYTSGFENGDNENGDRKIPNNEFYVVGYYFAGWQVVGTNTNLENEQEITAADMLSISKELGDATDIKLLAIWKSIFSEQNVSVDSANKYRNGKTEDTAFIISDVNGLNKLSHTVSNGDTLSFDNDKNDYYNTTESGVLKYKPFNYEGYYFKLSDDFENASNSFTSPIGTAEISKDYNPDEASPEDGPAEYLSNTYPFSGTFDGNNQYAFLSETDRENIEDMPTDAPVINVQMSGNDFVGLFGYTENATIKNLKITGSVSGRNSVGAVIGFMNGGSLTNVVNDATISGTGYNVAGLVGTFYRPHASSTNDNLVNLVNNGDVTYNGAKGTELEYRDDWTEDKVLNGVEGSRYGGIVGQMWSGRINGGYNSGNITARMAAGGIVGTMLSMNDDTQNDSQINTALNIGNITVTSGLLSQYNLEDKFTQYNISAYAGGIAGRLFGASAITNVMNTGEVVASYVGYTTSDDMTTLQHLEGEPQDGNATYLGARGVGGIIGITSIEKNGTDFKGGNKKLEYAINTGTIKGWSSVGGLVGLLAYSDIRYTINGGTVEATGYHFVDGNPVNGGTHIYDANNNYKYYNYLGAIAGMAISANIDATNYFDGDIKYTNYTDAVVKATGDEVTSMGNGASTVAANKLASKELIVGDNNSKPSGLPETFFNTGWTYKNETEENSEDFYYYPQLSVFANNEILLKDADNNNKTISHLSMDGVILKAEDNEGIKPVEPSKPIIITLHLNGGYVDTTMINNTFEHKEHTYTYNDNGTLTLTIRFDATTGSIVLIDSKLVKYVGFNFGGWYKDNETFEEEFSGFLPSSNIDLYAKWEAINYNITYSGFGSYSDGDVKFDGDYVSSFTIDSGEITLPTNIISGNGAFKFKRWIYSSGGDQFEAISFKIDKETNTISIVVNNLDGTIHDPIVIDIANLEFTLECDPIDYKITYYDQAGNQLTEEELKNYNPVYTYTIRDNVNLPINVDRVGYKFIGWYTDKTLLKPATNIVRGTIGDQKFYAKFEPNNYALTIDLGRMGSLSGDSLKFTLNGTEYTLTRNNTTYVVNIPYGTALDDLLLENTGLKAPTPITGYSFRYYSLTDDGEEFDPTDVKMTETGLTLYAIYETTKYEITIDLSNTLIDGHSLTLPATNIVPGLDSFYEYKVNDNKLVLRDVEYHDNLEAALNLILKSINENNSTILKEWNFSKWEGPEGFSIYNVMGDDTKVSIKPSYLKETYTWTILDKDLQTVGTITNKDNGFENTNAIYEKFKDSLVPAGYTYLGFYDLSDSEQNLITGDLKITNNRNIVVKLDPKGLKVKFYDGDNLLDLEHTVYYEQEYGILDTDSKLGYNFIGWSLEENGSTIIQETDIVNVENINNTDSIKLYAVFELITYKVTFITNLNNYQIDDITFNIEDDESIDLNNIITEFIKYTGNQGYRFSYFTDQDGNEYNISNDTIKVATNLKNITLEAYYKAVKVLVIFNAGDGKFNVNQDDRADGIFVDSLDDLELQYIVNADEFDEYFESLKVKGLPSGPAKYYITYVDFGSRPLSPQYPVVKGYVFNKWDPDFLIITTEEKREYEALYNANTYTISFITNNDQTIDPLEGIKHNETISETQVQQLKKTNYEFKGWFIRGKDEEFILGQTKVTSNLTLEAKWDAIPYNLTITINHNIEEAKKDIIGALSELKLNASFSGNTLTVEVKYGTYLSYLNNIFNNKVYDVDGTKYYFESYSNGTFTTMPAENLIVDVIFSQTAPKKTVTIHYMSVKGDKISKHLENTISYTYTLDNDSYSFKNGDYEILILGHNFSGWYSDDKLQQSVDDFTWTSDENVPTDLYLKYVAEELEIKLTYIDANYQKQTETLTAYYGNTLNDIITETYKNERPGYDLRGFSEITNDKILEGSFVFTYNMALTYRDKPVTYGIKFSYTKPNGNGENVETEIFEIPYGEAIIYSDEYNEEYYDLAWYLDKTFDVPFNEATMPHLGDSKYESYVKTEGDIQYIIIYANYTPTEYTVNFDTDGGNYLEPLIINVEQTTYNLEKPTKEHYEFKNYTYGAATFNKDKSVTFEELINLFEENEKEITLKANYDLKEYTLKLDDNNKLSFDYEDTSVTITWEDPTKDGATFLGYALTENSESAEFLKTIPVSELLKHLDEDGDVTIYSVFSDPYIYQVMFIYETIDGIKTNTYQVKHGDTLGDSINNLGIPCRLGYEFKGWNENENAETFEPTEAIKQEKITKNTTYYAIFREIPYNITYVGVDGATNPNATKTTFDVENNVTFDDATKEGYTFVGWYLNGKEITNTNNIYQDITIEARFEAIKYVVTFTDGSKSYSQTFTYDNMDDTLTNYSFNKFGYTHNDWVYGENVIAANASFADILDYFDDNHTLTLNPNFVPNKYTFIYDGKEQFTDVTIDSSIDLSKIKVDAKTGYDRYQFIINGVAYGSTEVVNVKDIVTNDSVKQYEITLDRIPNEYEIIFDEFNETLTFKYEDVITGLPQANVKEGQEFVGWYYNGVLVSNGDKISDLVKDLKSNGSGKYELSFTAKYDNKMINGNTININGIDNTKALDDLKNTLRNKLDVHVDDDFSYKIEINDNNYGLIITYSARYDSDISFINDIFPSFIQYETAGIVHTLNLTGTGLNLSKQVENPTSNTLIYTETNISVTINYDGKQDIIYPTLDQDEKYQLDEAILKEKYNKVGYTIDFYTDENYTEDSKYTFGEESGSITLYIKYRANNYTVTINLDGGASEGFTGSTISVTYDSEYINLPNDPTKKGHTFVGWYLNNTLITEDSIVKVTDNSQTIVAKYNKNSYNVTFNTNGGSYVEGQTVVFGEHITKPEEPTKLGYAFKGWYKDNNIFEQAFDFENTTMGSDAITLYAKWEEETYNITYKGLDDATYDTSNKTTYTVKDDVTFGTPTKNGYRFVNWTLENGTVITSTKGYTEDLTVKANFEAITYHITYILDGANYSDSNETTYTVESVVTFGRPTKPGYEFKGWSLEDGKVITSTKGYTEDLTVKANFLANTYHISIKDHNEIEPIEVTYGEAINGLNKVTVTKVGYNFIGFTHDNLVITDGMIYNYDKDIVVEAEFSEIHYTIQFDANGGFGSVSSKNLSYNESYELPTKGYTKIGYNFIGWSKTNDGEVIENEVSMLSSVDNGVVTLYAIYEAIEYTISFENSSETIKIHYGEAISNLPTLQDNKGERFLGWYYNGVEIKDGMLYGYDSDIKLTAKFEEKVYYIYLDALGGNLENSVIEMHYGDNIDLSQYLPTAPEGYAFIGWDLDLTTMPDHNLNVRAKYEGIKYNIYFNANGANGNMTSQQATYGDATKLKANQFVKEGYVFIGWSLSPNGEILYKDESYVNVKVGGLTLYAIFEEATYKITYNLDGGKATNNPTTYTISSEYEFNKPTKEGYKFIGFYTEDGKLVESTLGLSGNLYLTAKYQAITYNITYTSDLNIDTNLLPKVYSKDNVVTFDSLSKTGYEFVGWYLNGKPVTSTLNMTGDLKLEARFKLIEYKITYILNGANNHQDNPLKYTIKDELIFKDPTKGGYKFNGWYLSGTNTKVENIIGKTGDLVLEARFTPEKVTVTFVDGNKEITKVEIDYNSTISQITDPTKEGYVFNSWHLDGNKYDFSKPVTKDITLEAFYNKIALSTTIDDKIITISSTSGKGLDPNYSLSVTKIVQELPLSNAIDLLYPLGDLVTLYDIKLLDKNGNIVDLGEDVKVTITDASLKEDITYAVVHVSDDYLEYSTFGEYKAANNTISFVTPHFSMFGVVEVFEPINLTWLWVLIVLAVTAGFAFAIVVIVKNRKYQIKFVTNGGSLIAPMRLKEDALVELPNAINPGYKFKGWYLDEKLMKEAHFGSMPKENLTLFAKWERDMEAPKSKQ